MANRPAAIVQRLRRYQAGPDNSNTMGGDPPQASVNGRRGKRRSGRA